MLLRCGIVLLLAFVATEAKSERCQQCEIAVTLIHRDWGENSTEECTVETAIWICDTFKIQDNFVCDHIVGEFADEFMYVVGQVILEPHEICGLIMEDCGTFYDPLGIKWNATIPGNQPAPVIKQPITPGNPTLRVLHLSDVHIDTQYTIGTEAKCSDPQCCRPPQDPQEVTATGNITEPAKKWGTVGDCDIPYWTVQNMMQFIQNNHKDLDYVVVSGDLMSHAVYEYDQTTHAAMVKNISDTIRSYLPNIPVFFAVGNHEGVPIDNFAPHSVPKKYHMDWLYDAMADAWSGWVPQDQMSILKYMGCYMIKLFPGLRLLSINNPLGGDSYNFWLNINDTDPDGTLSWVIEQLLEAEKAGDKVHIVAHIPGGDSESREGWSYNYYKVYNRFQNTISAHFMGHTHSDQFYIAYEDPHSAQSRPTGVIYSAPSVTTYSLYNPAYRIYTVDGNYSGSTYEVIDYEEWFLNLTTANAFPDKEPVWEQLFASINAEYGLAGQTPTEWNNFLNRMIGDDNLFEKYRENMYRRSQYEGLGTCHKTCKFNKLCDSRQFHHDRKLCSDFPEFEYTPEPPKYRRKSYKADPVREAEMKKRLQANDKCKI